MAAKILEDVLNNFISIDSLHEWLSGQNSVSDVNVFINQYKCNQVEFVSYFLNLLREQTSMILQSSCRTETPCKSSQSNKKKTLTFSSDKPINEPKFEASLGSIEKKLDFSNFESFPALTESSSKSKIKEKCSGKNINSFTQDFSSPIKDSSKKLKRAELFPGKKEYISTSQDNSHTSDFINVTKNQNPAIVSTPKSSGKESVDISEYFNDVVNIDNSPDWNAGFKFRRNHSEHESSDKSRQNSSGVSTPFKSTSFGSDTVSGRSGNSKSSSRLMLGDFLLNDVNPSESKKDKRNKVRKRINPTRVSSVSSQFEDGSSFEISNSTAENELFTGDEREALKIECANVLERLEVKATNTNNFNKDSVPFRFISTPSKKVMPNTISVTFVDELRILSKIYSYILDENYCQNIMTEFCFVISMLVTQDHTSGPSGSGIRSQKQMPKFLDSVHNCCYFAVETLWLQRNVLILLNLAALKLLSENKVVEKLNPDLTDFLTKAYVERQSKETLKRQIFDEKVTKLGNVSFECETDNKDNFTNDFNFHSFRKQRDLFYNILATWEENHSTTEWNFSAKLDSKIRALLSISCDPTNLLHLARLFRGQLVMSCCGDCRAEDESDEEIIQLLSSVDPNKILRLRARLRSRPNRQGPCPAPDFMGYQEFFKDFIISTSYTVFHYYLKNSLCDEILRLNDAEFSSDQEDDDSCLDQQTQNRYFEQINILCLLAKFLGFLEFLPYRSDKLWSDRVLSIHCSVRQNLLPLFDLESCLKTAFTRHKLTVTIPWIVNYLSMIDLCSARLKTYQNIWKMLIIVYRQLRTCKNMMNSFYLRVILGWIFQQPNFPSDLFYNVLEDMNKGPSTELSIEFSAGLDSYNFIEENILYAICPYLSEINTILTENSGCNVKHIRPVTQGSNSTSSQMAKQLQMRLEESFLHNQSTSTRRTIEFVTERVSSIAIKYLIHDVIPKVKEKVLQEVTEGHGDLKKVNEDIDAISERCYRDLISNCDIESWHLCSVRSERALSALLSLDLDSAVNETCTQLVTRQSAEKVKRWIQTHVTVAIIKTEFTTLIQKKNKRLAETSDLSFENFNYSFDTDLIKDREKSDLPLLDFDLDECSTSHIFITIRDIMLNTYEGRNICWNEIDSAFRTAVNIFENTFDLSPAVEKTFITLTLDLIIIICVRTEVDFRKADFYHALRFLKQLKEVSSPGSAMERIICPRNLSLLLRESKHKNKAWENLGTFFLFVMEEELLTADQVESQLVSLLRSNWEKSDGELCVRLISRILNDYADKNGSDKFTLLLEYLIETLRDNDESRPIME